MTEQERLDTQAAKALQTLRDATRAAEFTVNAHAYFSRAFPANAGILGMFEVLIAVTENYADRARKSAEFCSRIADEEAQASQAAE